MTYEDWYSQYVTLYKASLKPKTREEYQRLHRRYIAPALGGLDLETITPEVVQSVIIAAEASGSRTATAVYDLLRAVFRRAVRSRHITWSPIDALDRPAHHPQAGRALSGADYEAACEIARHELGVALALHAGLRRGEILALTWPEIDLRRGVIRVRYSRQRIAGETVTGPPKSATSVRDVPIASELAAILRAHWRLGAGLCVPIGPTALDRRWARAQAAAGIDPPYRLHDLRHTYASRLLLGGCPLPIIQHVIGHASAETTARIYLHVSTEDAIRACDAAIAALH